ncbi:MAG: TrkH family potassium uptake protein, partial [Oscillospiraceae bacterium]|nr:TrkH family potassium uptake protein [Oscillospiraceae bacterium]
AHSFGTAGTGGFGIKGDSIASYSPYLQWVITIFMILFGVNFNAYYFILFGKVKKAFGMEEVRWYFIIILVSTGIIFATLLGTYAPFEALTHAAFQVGTIITTTGFATADFDQWSSLAKTVLVLLMFVGACAGSTGGGIKVSRIVVLFKSAIREVGTFIQPRSVKRINVEGKPVEHEAIRSINVYLTTYVLIFAASVFIISFEGKDLVTTFTSVAATINNIGPGLELVGPTASFAHLTDLSKWTLIFDMLAGRLELFPMLILFHPTIWKQTFQRKGRR